MAALLLTVVVGVARWTKGGEAAREGLLAKDFGVVSPFLVTDQDGRPFDSGQLRGKVWVAVFMFTHCLDTCPRITRSLLLVQDSVSSVPGLKEKVRLVSFSVDPERDKPKDLSAYAAAYGADRSLWSFLTGGEGTVARISQEAFHLAAGMVSPAEGSPQVPQPTHSDRFVLVDKTGRVRDYYSPLSEKADLARLLADLKRLAFSGK